MTPNSAPASALPVLSRAGEKGAVPLLIPASSDSWDLQSPPAWKEVPDSRVETAGCSMVLPAGRLLTSAFLCFKSRQGPGSGQGQLDWDSTCLPRGWGPLLKEPS